MFWKEDGSYRKNCLLFSLENLWIFLQAIFRFYSYDNCNETKESKNDMDIEAGR